MVGNDVVDLADPEAAPAAQHPRFDQRVFTTAERALIAAATDPNRVRWMLWAAKESAFKLARRMRSEVVFVPRGFVVELDPAGVGTVRHGHWSCRVTVRSGGRVVHALAVGGDIDRCLVRVGRVPRGADPRHEVRRQTCTGVARALGVDPTTVRVASGPDRIPSLFVQRLVVGSLSLSHHGALVAFAWRPSRASHRGDTPHVPQPVLATSRPPG